MRRQRFPVMLSAEERRALLALAREDGLSGSAVVRRLICQEARRRGLWPTDASGTSGGEK
jgi:hypothetical protein